MYALGNPLKSYQKWRIGSDVRNILKSNNEIVSIVGEHIYPCIAPEGTTGPFIVYRREKYNKETVNQGVYTDDCKLSLTVISDSYDEGVKIAELIDQALTGDHMINNARVRMNLADSTEGYEDLKYFQVLLYDIK